MSKKAQLLCIENLEQKSLLSVSSNDPKAHLQWSLPRSYINEAWQWSTGSKKVVVAVIDSGSDINHPDLKNNLWVNPGEIPGDGIDNEGNGYVDDMYGWNFVDNNADVQDRYGHGTHIAGIIGAQGNNGVGVVGVNWNVSIMTLKFINDSGVGSTLGALRSMDYLLMMKNIYRVNIVVANASWGIGMDWSSVVYNKIKALNDAGMLLSVAAGNNGSNNDINPRYPSCYDLDNIISVGALDSDGITLANFSNYGSQSVDLVAPGSMIYSTIPYNNYGYLSGSSMASPFVAGTVALLNAIKPNISVAEARAAVFAGVDKIPGLFDKVSTGGKLNAKASISHVLGIPYEQNKDPIGVINYKTLKAVGGWAKDPDTNGVVGVGLWIDDTFMESKVTKSDGSFVFNLGGLAIGDHVIMIKAKDIQSDSWKYIASTIVSIKKPVVRVGFLSTNRIIGWAFSERSASAPVVVRILVNNKVVGAQWANQYRPSLRLTVGSAYHGFSVPMNMLWFRKGLNNITIQVYDPISKQVSVAWKGTLIK